MVTRFLVKKFDATPFLSKINNGKQTLYHQPGEVIFEQASPATTVFYLKDGTVKETITSEYGKSAVVRILEPGSFFGIALLDETESRLTTVTAISKCIVVRVTKTAMFRALIADPEFAKFFTAYLVHRSTILEGEKVDLLFNNMQLRLAKRLLVLAHVGVDTPTPISGDMADHETLSRMIGTTRPRVNFFLNRFRKHGLIDYERGMIIVKPELLHAVLEDSPVFHDET